jgi:hypothetical protein
VSLRLPEPGSFDDLLRPARIEVASLVRLSRHPATEPEPYWSAGVHRFDDPDFGGAGALAPATRPAASRLRSLKASSMSPGGSQGAPTRCQPPN